MLLSGAFASPMGTPGSWPISGTGAAPLRYLHLLPAVVEPGRSSAPNTVSSSSLSMHRRPVASWACPPQPSLLHLLPTDKMSESSSKSSQPLASKQEKDGIEKRRQSRPHKQPPKEPSKVPNLRDLGANQRGAKTRALPRLGKPRLQGGNKRADPKKRRRKKRASCRSHQKRAVTIWRSSFLLG